MDFKPRKVGRLVGALRILNWVSVSHDSHLNCTEFLTLGYVLYRIHNPYVSLRRKCVPCVSILYVSYTINSGRVSVVLHCCHALLDVAVSYWWSAHDMHRVGFKLLNWISAIRWVIHFLSLLWDKCSVNQWFSLSLHKAIYTYKSRTDPYETVRHHLMSLGQLLEYWVCDR